MRSEPTTSGSASSSQPVGSGLGLDVEARRARALELRLTTAHQQLGDPFPQPAANGDEARYANDVVGLANFTKALPHNDLGEVDPGAYRALLRALRSGRPADFKRIPLGGRAKLANPEGAFSFELQGPDPWQRPLPPPPAIASEAFAGEMTECYWLALARDVPYRRYGQEPVTAAAITDLRSVRRLPRPGRPHPVPRHRPTAARGEQRSVHLPVPAAALWLWQHPDHPALPHHPAGSDHLTSYAAWLAAQNGQPTSTEARFDPTPRYLRNGRDLGEWSHRDFSYQGPLVAALILLGYVARYGPEVLAATNPYRDHPTQTGAVSFGAPDILDQVARSANAAMKAAWYHKWLVHRRLRPEEAGGRLAPPPHRHQGLPAASQADQLGGAAAGVLAPWQLPVPPGLPRGLPHPPGLPGGHRHHRRRRVRVPKAMFNPDFVIPEPVVPSDDGRRCGPGEGEPLTVGGELDKLAFNMAFGRDTAGVHFRKDEIEGISLGEGDSYSAPASNSSAPTGNASSEGYERGGYEYSR